MMTLWVLYPLWLTPAGEHLRVFRDQETCQAVELKETQDRRRLIELIGPDNHGDNISLWHCAPITVPPR
jgi:hypothetical protein